MTQPIATAAWFEAGEREKQAIDLQAQIDALSVRLNQLEKAHNRLCHLCGKATTGTGTTIDQDNWAKNEMGEME